LTERRKNALPMPPTAMEISEACASVGSAMVAFFQQPVKAKPPAAVADW